MGVLVQGSDLLKQHDKINKNQVQDSTLRNPLRSLSIGGIGDIYNHPIGTIYPLYTTYSL